MPELPDVEVFRRSVARTVLRRRVRSLTLSRAGRLLEDVSDSTLRRRLPGAMLVATRRHGKLLFVELSDEGGALVFHFGMTGLLRTGRRSAPDPGHGRLLLELEGDTRLVYACPRGLGHIGLAADCDEWIRAHDLGPDALWLDPDGFVGRPRGRRGGIKSALTSQSLIAGLGHVYADETLYRSRLDPRTPVAHLDEPALRRLHRAMRYVLEVAIERGADPERVPGTWLLPHREEGARCPRCRRPLSRVRVGGRAGWVCEGCQERR